MYVRVGKDGERRWMVGDGFRHFLILLITWSGVSSRPLFTVHVIHQQLAILRKLTLQNLCVRAHDVLILVLTQPNRSIVAVKRSLK